MKRREDDDDGEFDVHVAAAQKLRHRYDDQNARQKRADQRDPADVVVHLVLLHLDDAHEVGFVHILRVIDVEARLIEQKRHPRDETQVVEVFDEVVILCHFFLLLIFILEACLFVLYFVTFKFGSVITDEVTPVAKF